jgi:hypothetical protein
MLPTGIEKYEPVSLNHNTSLRSIRLDVFKTDEGTTEWITETLSQIVSVHMVDVAFRITFWCNGTDSLLQWCKVDAILARPYYSKLRKVEISLFRWGGGDVDSSFAAYLPNCHARGILDVGKIGREGLGTYL